MDDATITRLCAEAMGHYSPPDSDSLSFERWANITEYAPLHDDAQAMALVKKLKINTSFGATHWYARYFKIEVASEDLNRAICECVAKMRNESHSSQQEN